jgi:hypothetical protein
VAADRRRIFGPDHEDTIASRENLAAALQGAGRTKEANAELSAVAAARRRASRAQATASQAEETPSRQTADPEVPGLRLSLGLDGDDRESLGSLWSWLREDRAMAEHGQLRLADPDTPEHRGAAVDVLQVVVNSGLAATQLVLAVAEWRRSRPSAPAVTITRETTSGGSVRIETSDPGALEQIVRELDAL